MDADTQIVETPGSRIRALMMSKNLNPYRLAAMANVSKTTVDHVIKTGGQGMTVLVLQKIAKALSVDPGAILTGLPEIELPPPPPLGKRGPKKWRDGRIVDG